MSDLPRYVIDEARADRFNPSADSIITWLLKRNILVMVDEGDGE